MIEITYTQSILDEKIGKLYSFEKDYKSQGVQKDDTVLCLEYNFEKSVFNDYLVKIKFLIVGSNKIIFYRLPIIRFEYEFDLIFKDLKDDGNDKY
jgi:hypothetical protein